MQKLAFLFSIVAIFFACNPESTTSTIMGYEYDHVIKTDGKKPGQGEYVFYDYYLKNDKGEMLEASKEKGGVSEFRIPMDDAYPKKAALIELMKIMSAGDSARLFYPIDSLPQTGGRFGDTKTLIYEVVVREVKTAEEYGALEAQRNAEMAEQKRANQGKVEEVSALVAKTLAEYKSGQLGDRLQSGNGLEYVIHNEGEGENIKRKDNVRAHYYGVLKSDGSMFDNSFTRGTPFTFVNGKGMVIRGWDEGFKLLKKGGAATLFIPYAMAYGEQGRPPSIPEKSDLVFYVEVEDVVPSN